MTNKVSIIIPCYNAEAFIDASICSVWEQDYPNVELIVVDDGSTDHSRERIFAWKERFSQKGAVLNYLYQNNHGPGAAINLGLKHITGDYLTLLDADDVYLPGAIGKKAKFLDEHPEYAGVRNNGWRVSGGKRKLFITSDEEKQITDLFHALSFGKTNNWAGTYMVRTAILFSEYPDRSINPSRLGQNFQILLPVAYRRKFGYIDEPLMEYRIQDDSHSQASDPERQYHLECSNALGWRDIYMDILGKIVANPKEHEFYRNAYNSVFYRRAMNRAVMYGKREDILLNYQGLQSTGLLTLEDRIEYCHARKSPLQLPLRILRKLEQVFPRHEK